MSINKHNYESFLVDYAEGNLSPQQLFEVKNFLKANPDIKEEFELFVGSEIESENIQFVGKDLLKSIPYEKTSAKSEFFQKQCVAKIENSLSKEENKQFEKSVTNDPDKLKEFQLFSKTILHTEGVIFNEKLTLKQDFTQHVINSENINEYCVACTEGWLNHEGMVALNDYIAANPEMKKEYELFRKIKLSPDYNIVFPNKTSLKKYRILEFATARNFSIAASVAAVLTLGYFGVQTPEIINNVQTASTVQVQNYKQQNNATENSTNSNAIILTNKANTHSNVAQKQNVINSNYNNKTIDWDKNSSMEVIKPKTINYIECEKCTSTPNNQLAILEARVATIRSNVETETVNSESDIITPKTLAVNLLKSGVAKIDKLTKGKINVVKGENNEKAKFEISTKYLAFSTNINSKRKN